MSRYTLVDSGEDDQGRPWQVGVTSTSMVVTVPPGTVALRLSGERREKFAEAVARAAMPGQRVNHGPQCGCTPCLAESSYAERRTEAARAVPGASDRGA